MISCLLRRIAVGLACFGFAWSASATANGVVLVGTSTNFPDLATAVAAAPDGATLLVNEGTFGGFTIDGRSLAVFAAPGARVHVDGAIVVRNVGASQRVVLSGLVGTAPVDAPALDVSNCAGDVRISDCSLAGGAAVLLAVSGVPGASVRNSLRVVLERCTLVGGLGGFDCFDLCSLLPGGPGIAGTNSAIITLGCTVRGGAPGGTDYCGGPGGDGAQLAGSTFYARGTAFVGRNGGEPCSTFGSASGGSGGDALELVGSTVDLRDCPLTPGLRECVGSFCGSDGLPIRNLGSALTQSTVPHRGLSGPGVWADDAPATWTVAGRPGDRVFLAWSQTPGFAYQPKIGDVWLVPQPAKLSFTPLAVVAANGEAAFQQLPAKLGPNETGRTYFLQAYVLDAQGAAHLGSTATLLLLNADGPVDCDANQVLDYLQTSDDCDADFVPDACELAGHDCNGNQVLDACEIAIGSSLDLDVDGVPDECQTTYGTWYVDAAAPPGGDGSAAHPFTSLAKGVASAQDGDQVLVADGVYSGAANRNVDFGGKTLRVRSVNGPAACIVDLQLAGRAFTIDSGEKLGTEVRGFTFLAGNGAQASVVFVKDSDFALVDCVAEACRGPVIGFVASNAPRRLRVERATFRDNEGLAGNSQPSVLSAFTAFGRFEFDRCDFVRNSLLSDSAIEIFQLGGTHGAVSARVLHSRFAENGAATGQSFGGAILCRAFGQPGLTIDDCQFLGNAAQQGGGAVKVGGPARITNSTFVGNRAAPVGGLGGAVCAESTSEAEIATIENCVFADNSAALGADVYSATSEFPLRFESDAFALGPGSIEASSGCAFSLGRGILYVDPQFVDPDGPDGDPLTFLDNVYRLKPDSPCLDAGNSWGLPPDLGDVDEDANTHEPTPLDHAGKPRRRDVSTAPDVGFGPAPFPDLGAFERQF
ncbi:MAG: hypothetical protein L6Q99_10240 [Planctomycetes bacterium]|nr:hypothetical protein [Planctomycetota bacterium]